MGIAVSHLRKEYSGKEVLNIEWLAMDRGEIVGLVGNNGAGKTTLLRLLLDLIAADDGEVCSDGDVVSRGERWKTYTGSYLDEGFLIDYLTAAEFLRFVAAVRGLSKREREETLERFRIFFNGDNILESKTLIRGLSKGNIQKVGITSAFLGSPRVVVLDEPYANLDPTSQLLLKKILREYCDRTNALILLSSHNLSHVVGVCSRVIVLSRGRIVRDEPIPAEPSKFLSELEQYFFPGA